MDIFSYNNVEYSHNNSDPKIRILKKSNKNIFSIFIRCVKCDEGLFNNVDQFCLGLIVYNVCSCLCIRTLRENAVHMLSYRAIQRTSIAIYKELFQIYSDGQVFDFTNKSTR